MESGIKKNNKMEAPNDNCKHLSRSHKDLSNKCDYCKDIFRVGYKRHVGLCKLYSNHINKIDTGLQCKICFTCLPKKSQMFRHFKLHKYLLQNR